MVISPLNYPGNKAKSLKEILQILPDNIDCFVDAFCGSGIVAYNSSAKKVICNDISSHVIDLLKYLNNNTPEYIINLMDKFISHYGFTDTTNKNNVYVEEKHEGLSRLNKEPFSKLKIDYNIYKSVELLFALIIYAFNHYLRFNKKNEYNVPVGKVDFSNSLREKTISFSNRMKSYISSFYVGNFTNTLLYEECTKESLVYFDPPYLITNAPYNINWTDNDDKNLFQLFDKLSANGIRVAMSNVFESNGKSNISLIEWAKKYNVHHLKRQYRNANYQKINVSDSQEVLITNF